jgi:phosphatidylserine/phosphatidylglycerophosphate/cardiolipin synthase-like enzyme
MKAFVLLLLLFLPLRLPAQITVYFNRPVDTTLAWPAGNRAQGDRDFTQIVRDELDRARWSIDMAIYNINSTAVVEGLIDAKRRGVKVRVIGHVTNLNDAGAKFSQLVAEGIPVASNPSVQQGIQPLMHDKFFVIDARPGAPAGSLPVTITGSWNATAQQTYYDPNNLVVIGDSAVSGAYLREFEEMWGGSADTFDTVAARFGSAKSDNTDHEFTLEDGTTVELRFSPSDGTSSRIAALLSGAENFICTANLTFTYRELATTLKERRDAGVDVRCIIDNVDDQGSQFGFLQTFADVYDWQLDGLFHHKYAVIDAPPVATGSDPVVVTGSHNWTFSAESYNDENALVIHSARIANQYLQEFAARYREVGGRKPFLVRGDVADAKEQDTLSLQARFDPASGGVVLRAGLQKNATGEIVIHDLLGRRLASFDITAASPFLLWSPVGQPSGIYFATLVAAGRSRSVMVRLVE